MSDTVNFNDSVFNFIQKEYDAKTLKKVQGKKYNETVTRILGDSLSKSYSVEKTGNKILAMLRLNP